MNSVSTQKTPVQKALVAMRKRLKLTQQQLATAMKLALPTIGKWESTRSPTGSSLAQLASFAHQAGDEESAKIFHQAAIPNSVYDDIDQFETQMLARAGEAAIRQLRNCKHNPRVAAEYLKVLRALLRAYHVLTDEAVEGLKRQTYSWNLESIAQAYQNLRKEIENEQAKKR
jgi:transcriptional regulator with XRE-family HTH domain